PAGRSSGRSAGLARRDQQKRHGDRYRGHRRALVAAKRQTPILSKVGSQAVLDILQAMARRMQRVGAAAREPGTAIADFDVERAILPGSADFDPPGAARGGDAVLDRVF